LDLTAWQQATGMDGQSVIKQPVFAQDSKVLATQSIEQQTIGLTHDYSHQTHSNSQPQTLNDTQRLQQMFDQAITSKQSKLTIVPGIYRIDQSLMIVNANDLHIDATDVKLVMTKWDTAIKVIQCSGLELSGLTVDYDPLPMSQGVVTSVAEDGSSFEMKLDKGYPTLEQLGSKVHMHVFDPATRYWKADVWDMSVRTVTLKENGHLAVTPQLPETNLAIGDLIAMNIRRRNAMIIAKAKGVNVFREMTFLCSPGLVIVGRDCEDTQRFDRVVIKPGPKPVGATTERLMSSSADGVNFAYCRKGPILENCDFSFMGDDSVNVHGAMMPVVAAPDKRTLIVAKMYDNDIYAQLIKPQDAIRIMAKETFAIQQQAKVLSIREHPKTLAFDVTQMQKTFFPQTVSHLPSDQYTLFEVKLDQDHHASAMQQVVDFPSINCPGYVIRNNHFHDHRARAMRLMGNDGLVEGNTIERIGQAAISFGAEMGYWAIAGWVDNLTIRNNTIIDVNRDKNAIGEGTMALGAICSFVRTNVKTNPYPGHRNITIQNNTIDGSGTAGIHLYATDAATITGNSIRHVNRRSNSQTGSKWGLTVSDPIEFHGDGRKSITGNSVQ
jgi:parallel beta-helix repeat protein